MWHIYTIRGPRRDDHHPNTFPMSCNIIQYIYTTATAGSSHQDHQEATGASTNFRLLGGTHQSNVLLRRSLAAMSGTPAAHFSLPPLGWYRSDT